MQSDQSLHLSRMSHCLKSRCGSLPVVVVVGSVVVVVGSVVVVVGSVVVVVVGVVAMETRYCQELTQ